MIDLVTPDQTGLDLGLYDSQVQRAGNILSVQIGSLEYADSLGIDLKFFLTDQFKVQNDSFRAYLIEVLAAQGINVSTVAETLDNLFSTYTFNLTPDQTGSGMIAG